MVLISFFLVVGQFTEAQTKGGQSLEARFLIGVMEVFASLALNEAVGMIQIVKHIILVQRGQLRHLRLHGYGIHGHHLHVALGCHIHNGVCVSKDTVIIDIYGNASLGLGFDFFLEFLQALSGDGFFRKNSRKFDVHFLPAGGAAVIAARTAAGRQTEYHHKSHCQRQKSLYRFFHNISSLPVQ